MHTATRGARAAFAHGPETHHIEQQTASPSADTIDGLGKPGRVLRRSARACRWDRLCDRLWLATGSATGRSAIPASTPASTAAESDISPHEQRGFWKAASRALAVPPC